MGLATTAGVSPARCANFSLLMLNCARKVSLVLKKLINGRLSSRLHLEEMDRSEGFNSRRYSSTARHWILSIMSGSRPR
jgi:hypothetical protein